MLILPSTIKHMNKETEMAKEVEMNLSDAKQIYLEQYALALKYQMVIPKSKEPTPTEQLNILLMEAGLPFLPSEVMVELARNWMQASVMAHSRDHLFRKKSPFFKLDQ